MVDSHTSVTSSLPSESSSESSSRCSGDGGGVGDPGVFAWGGTGVGSQGGCDGGDLGEGPGSFSSWMVDGKEEEQEQYGSVAAGCFH